MIFDKIYTFTKKDLQDLYEDDLVTFIGEDEKILFMSEDRFKRGGYSEEYVNDPKKIDVQTAYEDLVAKFLWLLAKGYKFSTRCGFLANTIIFRLSKDGKFVDWAADVSCLHTADHILYILDKLEAKFAPPEIIAVDFDGTLCENKWPEIGESNWDIIRYLRGRKDDGAKLILWTCREGKRLKEALTWCKKRGLEFDAVNENLKSSVEHFGEDTRKIYATEYIDDKNCTKFKLPFKAD